MSKRKNKKQDTPKSETNNKATVNENKTSKKLESELINQKEDDSNGQTMSTTENNVTDEFTRDFDIIMANESESMEERLYKIRELFADQCKLLEEETAEQKRIDNECNYLASQHFQHNAKLSHAFQELEHFGKLRENLQTYCRDLQKQNALLNEKIEGDQKNRESFSVGFESTVKEVTQKMEEQKINQQKTEEENERLREQLSNIAQQVELYKTQTEAMLEKNKLEAQLHEATLQEQGKLLEAERARSQELFEQLKQLRKSEKIQQSKLEKHTKKFEQFQSNLKGGNQSYDRMKEKMDSLGDEMVELEKQNQLLQQQYTQLDQELIQVMEKRNKGLQETMKLKNLSRTLRNDKISQLEEIDRLNAQLANLSIK